LTYPSLKSLRRLALLLACAALALPATAQAAAHPLVTGLQDFDYTQTHFDRVKASGARVVKINLSWRAVAPTTPPPNFNPASPVEPSYDWEPYDTYVRTAVATGLQPLITVEQAAAYAERDKSGSAGTGNPDPVQFGLFGEAVPRRYGGGIAGLPRVRMFEAWNEPNANFFLYPARVNGQDYTPGLYREMVNLFSAGVHRAHADNVVVAGGTSPYGDPDPGGERMQPARFVRELVCAGRGRCPRDLDFDVLSHHPYSVGRPRRRALNRDDVSIPDLGKLRRILAAARRQSELPRTPRLWVTEVSYDSSPPDPDGVPAARHARWVAETLYLSWRQGASAVV